MSAPRTRILFLAEGATMAHFVRPLALAESLDPARYEVHFYAPARFRRYLENKPFTAGELASMPGGQFLTNIAKGKPMFPAPVLRGYVHEERGLLQRLQPQIVVGDMRLSLSISARLEKVPCAVMINAYWSPYTKRRSILPEIPLTRLVPPRLLVPMYKLTEPIVYAMHVGQMNRLRKEFGLPPLAPDLRYMYTDGDYVLYADVPEFIPAHGLPPTHFYIGPCEWTAPTARPEWWQRMLDDSKPKVFVSLGSSGPLQAFPALMKALETLPVSVIVSRSGRDLPATLPGAYVADLLPFTETAAASSVVVSHGGSGGLYPAMAAGTPVLGIPSNADQHLSTATLEENGAGLGVRVEEASEANLRRALEKLLFEPQYKASARHWKEVFARYDSARMFEAFLASALSPSAASS